MPSPLSRVKLTSVTSGSEYWGTDVSTTADRFDHFYGNEVDSSVALALLGAERHDTVYDSELVFDLRNRAAIVEQESECTFDRNRYVCMMQQRRKNPALHIPSWIAWGLEQKWELRKTLSPRVSPLLSFCSDVQLRVLVEKLKLIFISNYQRRTAYLQQITKLILQDYYHNCGVYFKLVRIFYEEPSNK